MAETDTKSDSHEKESRPGANYEYLDHTADIQLHAWGNTLQEAFEAVVLAMFNYMTDLDRVEIDESITVEVDKEGHDLESLLYNYMDEFLFIFSTELIICKEVKIVELDRSSFHIRAIGRGEKFDRSKHTQGTEVKAITYSAMKITETAERTDVYVIVDI